jgi:spore coat polysaccharide biosynthesis protein SpsF
MTRIIATVEARMGSTRLPGKTLMILPTGETLLDLVVSRLRRIPSVHEVWVATSLAPQDDQIQDHCRKAGIACHRGSEEDVLDRVCGALRAASGDMVVQAGGDGPYVQPPLVEELINRFRTGRWDFVCSDMRLTYPLGVYGHVLAADTLHRLNARKDLTEADRVDVVRAIFEHPETYRILSLTAPERFRRPDLRLTIDHPQDMALLHAILAEYGSAGLELVTLLEASRLHPDWFTPVQSLAQVSSPHLMALKGYEEIEGVVWHA